jgi:hypothetical protein
VALAAYSLRRKRALSVVFVVGTVTMLSITLFVWYGSVRHHGQILLWYLVCAWLWYCLDTEETTADTPAPWRGLGGTLLTILLLGQALAGAHAYAMDLRHPFSNAKAVGLHLRHANFEDVTLAGSIDYAVQPIAAFVERPIYYAESGDFRTFLDWGPSREIVPPQVVLRDALALLREHDRDVVIVFSYQPGTMQPGETLRLGPDARLHCFARFDGALVPDENYHLCRAYPAPTDVDSPNTRTDNYEHDTTKD